MSAGVRVVVKDNLNQTFDPSSCSHALTYDAHGNLLTDTATESNGATVRVKTFTYVQVGTAYFVETESLWINESSSLEV
ncbi:hypothetical protein [Paraburkholderia sp. BCC1876]|uniref:hypothetical protein n=1 Tax=Paraburkholderia sp. BCC1876 TaxID=2676303 RepID=UPI00158FA36A|nr:hypothetical protein [Paraburkholderia sp. BCC1876]